MEKEPESNAWKKRKKMAAESLEKDKMKFINTQIVEIRPSEIRDIIYAIFPEAQFEYDNDGQVIIYTGVYDKPEEENKD